ncbi:MAG: YceI family protein [Paracoccus sp. (in: a-proteobacteria)]
MPWRPWRVADLGCDGHHSRPADRGRCTGRHRHRLGLELGPSNRKCWHENTGAAQRDRKRLRKRNQREYAPLWQVQQGTLGITVQQSGSPVAGQFGQWQAHIDYDPDSQSGHVAVDIDVATLTLGSVSSTATGPDFLNAAAHPTAQFAADILPPAAEGQPHIARGTLTIAGKSVPAELPLR